MSTIPAFKEYSSQLSFDYLDASLIATVRLAQETVRPHFFLGGIYGALVGARQLFETNRSVTGGAVIDPVKVKLGRHYFGATAGAGFTVKAGQTSIVVEARYMHGFTDLYGDAELSDVNGARIRALDGYDRTVSAHLGWLIPLPKRAVVVEAE